MYDTLRFIFGKHEEKWIQDKLSEDASWWMRFRRNLSNWWHEYWTRIRGYKYTRESYYNDFEYFFVSTEVKKNNLEPDLPTVPTQIKDRTIYFYLDGSSEHRSLKYRIKTCEGEIKEFTVTPQENITVQKLKNYPFLADKIKNKGLLGPEEQLFRQTIEDEARKQEDIAKKELVKKSREWTQKTLPKNANFLRKFFRNFNNRRHKILANLRGYSLNRRPYTVQFVDILPQKEDAFEEYTLYLQKKADNNTFQYSVKTPKGIIKKNVPLKNENTLLTSEQYDLLKQKKELGQKFNQHNKAIIASILEETGRRNHTAEICCEKQASQKHQQAEEYEAFSDRVIVGDNAGYSAITTLNNFVILADMAGLGLMAMTAYGVSVLVTQAALRSIANLIELKNKRNKNLNIWQKALANTGIFLVAIVLLTLAFGFNLVYQDLALETMAFLSLAVSALRFVQCLIFVLHHAFELWRSGFNIFDSNGRLPNELQARHLTQLSKRFIQMKAAGWMFLLSLITLGIMHTKVGKIFTSCAITFNFISTVYTTARELQPFKNWFRFTAKKKIPEHETLEEKRKRFNIINHKKIHHNDLINEIKSIAHKLPCEELTNEELTNKDSKPRSYYKFLLVSERPEPRSLEENIIYIFKDDSDEDGQFKYCLKSETTNDCLKSETTNESDIIDKDLNLSVDIKEMIKKSMAEIGQQEKEGKKVDRRLYDLDCIHAILHEAHLNEHTQNPIQIQNAQRQEAYTFMKAMISDKITALNETIMDLEKKSSNSTLKYYHKKYFLELLDRLIPGDSINSDHTFHSDKQSPPNPFDSELGTQIKCITDIDKFFDDHRKIEINKKQNKIYWSQKLRITKMSTLEIGIYDSFLHRNGDTEVIFRALTVLFECFPPETKASECPTISSCGSFETAEMTPNPDENRLSQNSFERESLSNSPQNSFERGSLSNNPHILYSISSTLATETGINPANSTETYKQTSPTVAVS